jgi:hypothetical protein
MNTSQRTIVLVLNIVVLVAFFTTLLLTDISMWLLFAGALIVLVPAQLYLNRTKTRR